MAMPMHPIKNNEYSNNLHIAYPVLQPFIILPTAPLLFVLARLSTVKQLQIATTMFEYLQTSDSMRDRGMQLQESVQDDDAPSQLHYTTWCGLRERLDNKLYHGQHRLRKCGCQLGRTVKGRLLFIH